MEDLNKEFDKKYKGKLEIETEDGLRYFVDEEVKSFIRQREKEAYILGLTNLKKAFKELSNE